LVFNKTNYNIIILKVILNVKMKKLVFAVAVMFGTALVTSCSNVSSNKAEFVEPDSDSTFVSAVADTLRQDTLDPNFNPDSFVVDTVPVYL
jgi:hypothetical protein